MQKDHIRPLTGLRWIAALFVYLSHTVGDNNLPSSLLQFTENGYNGVTIFFVLSAFILTVNYHASLNLRGGGSTQILDRSRSTNPSYLLHRSSFCITSNQTYGRRIPKLVLEAPPTHPSLGYRYRCLNGIKRTSLVNRS